MNSRLLKQPWINSGFSDSVFIILPPFLALLLVAAFPAQFKESADMPAIYWFILVVCIDVAHVYSTLYRTYFNKDEYQKRKSLLLGIPLLCYVSGVVLYNLDSMIFWRILAYLAVFHFIRQQYGFMRLYSRTEQQDLYSGYLDTIAIYAATLYPLIYWHTTPDRNFNWFIDKDFFQFTIPLLYQLTLFYFYLGILVFYLLKEIKRWYCLRVINIPKNLLILGTALSWYFGIVYFNGDMAFTTLNVVSHGVPYMALIWFLEKKKHSVKKANSSPLLKASFGTYGIAVFVLVLVIFAYTEEGLWDSLIWKEHLSLFPSFSFLPGIEEKSFLSLLIPLLALPQSTHYVLDGFIWKKKDL